MFGISIRNPTNYESFIILGPILKKNFFEEHLPSVLTGDEYMVTNQWADRGIELQNGLLLPTYRPEPRQNFNSSSDFT